MNVVELKELLYNSYDNIIKILEKIGCGKIKVLARGEEIRCSLDLEPSSNGNSIRIKTDKLSVASYSDRLNFSGDLISFVMIKCNCKFIEALKIICDAIGVEFDYKHAPSPKKTLPFGGYYKNITTQQNIFEESITYPDSIMEQFYQKPSRRFLDDGIDVITQMEFGVCYDFETERICLPWRNNMGRIVGITARWNGDDYEECGESKYKIIIPIHGFQKSKHIFGYSENYQYIQEDSVLYIFEAEKSVLQTRSMDIRNTVAIGSHNISDIQAQLIKSLMPQTIILCFDEDVKDEEFLKEQCKKLQYNNSFINADIGYLLDKENKYLSLNSKKSPSDLRREKFLEMLTECIAWI